MQLKNRIETFCALGRNLESFICNFELKNESEENDAFAYALRQAWVANPWFTIENQLFALKQWSKALTANNINKWLSGYTLETIKPKTVGIVAAGNIPLVGFHDLLCVLLSGHRAKMKLASDDAVLMQYVIEALFDINPEMKQFIEVVDKLQTYEAVIATGSDNTARYFHHYFKNTPNIIRKNRTSVALLTGNESPEEIACLCDDIFLYFGLGCRNVTKLYVPKNYDLDILFNAFYKYKNIINHHKYANNFDYHRAIYLMKKEPFLENGFVLLKEEKNLFSPISVLHYEEYTAPQEALKSIDSVKEKIQCIVTHLPLSFSQAIAFGSAQTPQLWNYADGVDTLKWLSKI